MRIKLFNEWLNEDFAEVGSMPGMGDVTPPTSNTEGSGDCFPSLGEPSTSTPNKVLKENTKPDFFSETKYRLPTADELKEIDSFNLDAKEIISGMTYTMVGRGIQDSKNILRIINATEMLSKMFPTNSEYSRALKLARELKPRDR